MTEFEARVLGQLKPGLAHAIPARLIAQRLEVKDTRMVRVAILSLLEQRQPILSTVGEKREGKEFARIPRGYFIAETQAEVRDYLESLQKRIIGDAWRRKLVKRATEKLLKPEQLKLGV